MYTIEDAHKDGWKGEEAEEYVKWKNEITRICERETGFPDDFLVGDWHYADAFDDGVEPEEAAEEIIEESGFPTE